MAEIHGVVYAEKNARLKYIVRVDELPATQLLSRSAADLYLIKSHTHLPEETPHLPNLALSCSHNINRHPTTQQATDNKRGVQTRSDVIASFIPYPATNN